jgi:hypothetical protein
LKIRTGRHRPDFSGVLDHLREQWLVRSRSVLGAIFFFAFQF